MNTNTTDANVQIGSDFLWAVGKRYAELYKIDMAEIETLVDIATFVFYGDVLVFSAPSMIHGVHNTATEFAEKHNLIFKAANAAGESWLLRLPNIEGEEAIELAYRRNKELGGTATDRETWDKDRQYFRSI